jgi:hypothetical protein
VKTQTEKEHTEKKENQSQAYGHPVYSALDMHLTDRIDKGDRLGVRVDLIKCLRLLGLYEIKKSMVRGHMQKKNLDFNLRVRTRRRCRNHLPRLSESGYHGG